tara:strand:- start:42 stop:626 length:585 start_codon:yes stop_codon:yes gene_type:complete
MERNVIDVYDKSIFEMRNVFTAEECQEFIDYHEQSPNKRQGTLMWAENLNLKKSVDIYISDPTNNLLKRYIEGLKKVHMEYTKHLQSIFGENSVLPIINRGYSRGIIIQRTDKGGYFHWHSDYNKSRMLAVIVYLNDINEENGGSTEFNSCRKVQPETGKVLMFPTTDLHIHRGNTILNGHPKYIISSFINDTI